MARGCKRLWMGAGVAALLAGHASAAEPAEPQLVQEVVVTGERASRSLKATAASVAVVTEADLTRLAAPDRVEQILQLTPNIQLGGSDQGPSIRGQESTGVLQGADAFLGGTRPRATLQVDGRALGYNEFIYGLQSVWDVNRVEVFRGPQTTTQGRNSIAGAIFVETKDPTFEREGRVRALVGDYETRQGSLAVSGPLIGDQVAGRLAVDVREHQSWVDYTGGDAIVGADRSEDDYALVRGKLLIQPDAAPGLRVRLTYAHLESRNPQGEAVQAPFGDRAYRNPDGGYWKTDVDSLVLDVDHRLSPALDLNVTAAFGDSVIERLSSPGGGQAVVEAQDLSLEAVLRWSPAGGRVDGLAGVYGLRTEQDEFIDLSAFLGLGDFTDEQTSLGVFGEGTFAITPRLRLTAGARLQRDRQEREGVLAVFAVDYEKTYEAFLPKLSLAYDLTADVRVGATVQKGFNPGGTTISFETGRQDQFEDETLWNYEAFLRSSHLDGRLRLNANAFYADYADAQRPLTEVVRRPDGSVAFQTEIANAPEARAYGLEAEVQWSVTDRFALRAAAGLLDTEIERALDDADPIVGKEFQRAPGYSGSVAATYEPVDGLSLDVQVRRNDSYFSDDANTRELRVGSSTTVDAQAAYRFRNLRLFAYARNAFDDFQVTQLYAPDFGTANDPREVGVGVEARF